jgi:hypothetical protein
MTAPMVSALFALSVAAPAGSAFAIPVDTVCPLVARVGPIIGSALA